MVPLVLKILGAVSGAALLATGGLYLLPGTAPIQKHVWLDAPADGSTLDEGPITLTLHTSIPDATRLSVSVQRDGAEQQKLTSQSVERTARGSNAVALATATLVWMAKPGVYTLQLGACVGGTCTTEGSAKITVVEQGGVLVDTATASPDPEETTEPEPEETEEPVEPDPDPEPDPSDDPDPDPDPAPTPTGLLTQNFRDGAKTATTFVVTRIAPAGTTVSVRVQVGAAGNGYDESSWTVLPCPVSGTTCTTPQFDAGLGGGQQRWGFYQLVLKNGSNVVYGDVGFWELVR